MREPMRGRGLTQQQDPIRFGQLALTAMKKSSLGLKKALVLFNASLLVDCAFLAFFAPVCFAAFTFLSAWAIGKMCCILAPIAITSSESTQNYEEI